MHLVSPEQLNTLQSLTLDQPKRIFLNDQEFIAIKTNRGLNIYLNRCPHQHKRLWSEDESIWDESSTLLECGFHGAQFVTTTGECVQGPCLGSNLIRYEIKWFNDDVYLVQS